MSCFVLFLALCVAIWFTGGHALAVPVYLGVNISESNALYTSPVSVLTLRIDIALPRTACAVSPTSVRRSDAQPIAGTRPGPLTGIFATVATQRNNLTHTEVVSDSDVCSGFNGIGDMTFVYIQFGRALRADDVLVIVDTRPADDIAARSDMSVRIERLSDNQTIGSPVRIQAGSEMWSAHLGSLSCRATVNRFAADSELTFLNIR
jgi:hypothetical protein